MTPVTETAMNLKQKATHRLTCTVKFVSDTVAIFSNECSPTHVGSLLIIEGADKADTWAKVKAHAIETARATRFPCTIGVITPDDKFVVQKPALPVSEMPDSEYAA